MTNLKIHLYKEKQEVNPEIVVTMPLSLLHVAIQLIPKKIQSILDKEGIDLLRCSEFSKEKGLKGPIKGPLIEIENPNEKVVISIE